MIDGSELRTFLGGGMKKDPDPAIVKNPDYLDARNIRKATEDGSLTGNVIPILGNEFSFDLGTLEAQNKVVKFSFTSILDNTPHTVEILLTAEGIVSQTLSASFTGTTQAQFATFINSNIPSNFTGSVVSVAASGLFVLLTFDANVILSQIDSQGYSFITTQEYIETGGDVTPLVGSRMGDISYILSCVEGGYGELGRVWYDPSYLKWNYTRLLGSVEFGLLITKRPDTPEVESNNQEDSIYWVDDLNVPRCVYAPLIASTVTYSGVGVLRADNPELVDFTKISVGSTIRINGESATVGSISSASEMTISGLSQAYINVRMDVQDICLESVYSDGRYKYDFIDSETDHFIGADAPRISDVNIVGGGAVTAGNKRYIVRGVTADLVTGNWSRPSFMINYFGSAETFYALGDPAGTETGKAGNISISNINTSLFLYIDVAVIDYNGQAISGSIFKRIQISGSTATVIHLGNEPDSIELNVNALVDVAPNVRTAKTNLIIDNRYVLGNVTFGTAEDLSDFALTIEHSLFRELLPQTQTAFEDFGEYMNPENVFGYGGLMINEVYRDALRVTFPNGSTGTYWIDDIKIDNSATNITAGKTYNGNVLPNRRVAGLTNIDISDADRKPYTYGIEYHIDTATLIQLAGVGSTFEIVRARVIPEVLLTGYLLPTSKAWGTGIILTGDTTITSPVILVTDASSTFVGDYIHDAAGVFLGRVITVNTAGPDFIVLDTAVGYTATGVTFFDYKQLSPSATVRRPFLLAEPDVYNLSGQTDYSTLTFYSPDMLYGVTSVGFQAGDVLKIIPHMVPKTKVATGGSTFFDITGDFSVNADTSFADATVSNVTEVGIFESASIFGGTFDNKIEGIQLVPYTIWACEGTLVINTTAAINTYGVTVVSTPSARPIYYAQYYREILYTSPDQCKYGTVSSTIYEPIGAVYTGEMSGTVDFKVYGNDIFTQLSWLKLQYQNNIAGYVAQTNGAGMSFISQNRGNIQMRSFDNTDATSRIYPGSFTGNRSTWLAYLYQDGSTIKHDAFIYSDSYNYNSGIELEAGFNPNLDANDRQITAVIWSDPKAQNSLSDSYRYFRVGNIKYLNNTDGAIWAMFKIGSELYIVQNFTFSRQFFNTRATLEASDNSQILIGAGAVLNRDGVAVTRFGSQHQHSCFKGVSRTGDDTLYFWDQLNKKICRFGGNGLNPISDDEQMSAWIRKYAQWCNKDVTAYGWGVHGIFDIRFKEALFTFRGQRNAPFADLAAYTIGDVVSSTTAYEDNFYDLPITLYRAKITGTLSLPTGQNDDPNWEFVELTDTDYYSFFTLAYNEMEGKFHSIYDFVPNIYIPLIDIFMTPDQSENNKSKVYTHDMGEPCRFWEDLDVEPEITFPANQNHEEDKKFISVFIDSSDKPDRIDYTVQDTDLQTYMLASEIKRRRTSWVAAIRNDSTVTVRNPIGINSTWASSMKGGLLILRYKFGISQLIRSMKSVMVTSQKLSRKKTS